MSRTLAAIVESGSDKNWIRCEDGFKLSVVVHSNTYCLPRNGPAPYTHVEVGFPSQRPEPWDKAWRGLAEEPEEPTRTVYAYVPVALVEALIELHGGEK